MTATLFAGPLRKKHFYSVQFAHSFLSFPPPLFSFSFCLLPLSPLLRLSSLFYLTHLRTQFEFYATEIIKLVQWEVQYNFALMQQLSATVTSAQLLMGNQFPNYTDANFEVTGGYADGMGGIMMAGFCPLVQGEAARLAWEEYSYRNQYWLEDSKVLKVEHPGHRDALHGTIQDHEHDRRRRRRLQEEEEEESRGGGNLTELDFYANAIPRKIWRYVRTLGCVSADILRMTLTFFQPRKKIMKNFRTADCSMTLPG